jgi:hypothetical protein
VVLVQPKVLTVSEQPYQFVSGFGLSLLEMIPQGGVDELSEDLRLERGDAVTQEDKHFEIVVKALFLNTVVGVAISVGHILLPQQTVFEDTAQVHLDLRGKTVEQLGNLILYHPQIIIDQFGLHRRHTAFFLYDFNVSGFHVANLF